MQDWQRWWPGSPPWASPPTHSVEVERRITTLEIHKTDQEATNGKVSGRLQWLERGLQACISALLLVLFSQAPDKASALADVLIGILKR